jgi:hypothetical protein
VLGERGRTIDRVPDQAGQRREHLPIALVRRAYLELVVVVGLDRRAVTGLPGARRPTMRGHWIRPAVIETL